MSLPIFHVHGLFVALHGALINGSSMLWQSRFDPAWVVRNLPRATVFMGVPTMYVRLLGETRRSIARQCRNMRLFVSGSAPLLIDTFAQWQQRTGHTILERYGMSETAMLTSNPVPRRADGERRGGTVGFPLPGVDLRVRGDDRCRSAGGRYRQHSGARAQCVQGLLAHAGEDARRIHGRRLLQDRRRRPGRPAMATSRSSGAART